MAFGKVSKEDLIAAGLDPDEIKNSLKAVKDGSATKEDLVNVTNALTSITESIKGLETKLNSSSTNNENNNNNNNDNNNNNNDNNADKNRTKDLFEIDAMEFATDPGAHLRKITNAVVLNNAVSNMGLRRDNAYDKASQSLRGFKNDALRAEIDEKWKKYTPEVMVRAGLDPMIAIREIHDSVVGAHYEDIQRDSAKREGKFNLVQPGGSNRVDQVHSNGDDNRTAEQKLNAQELAVAKSFGMTAEEYLEEQKALISSGKYTQA